MLYEDMNYEHKIMFHDMLIDIGNLVLELMKCRSVHDAISCCDKIELWLLRFYYEFGEYKE